VGSVRLRIVEGYVFYPSTDYDCADLEKFRGKICQFPSATSTAILRANTDVQAIKIKFAREFWLTSGKETVKAIACGKLAEVVSCSIS
jgi:hypothetical protein